MPKRAKKCTLCNRSYKNDSNLAKHMMAKHPEDDVEVEETTPPTTPTHSSISTPLCHTLPTPKPTKDAAADKSIQTSVDTSVETTVPDYQRLYIESLLSQIVMLKHTVVCQESQINRLIELIPKQHAPAKHHAPAQQSSPEVLQQSSPEVPKSSSSSSGTNSSSNSVGAKSASKKENPPPPQNKPTKKEILVIGDSLLKGVDAFKTSRAKFKITKQVISGGNTEEIASVARAMAATRKPHAIIIHAGTNNLYPRSPRPSETEKVIAEKIINATNSLQAEFPTIKFAVSKAITREDQGTDGTTKIKNLNSLLSKSKLILMENSNILGKHLNGSKLHLNHGGDFQFSQNIANMGDRLV